MANAQASTPATTTVRSSISAPYGNTAQNSAHTATITTTSTVL